MLIAYETIKSNAEALISAFDKSRKRPSGVDAEKIYQAVIRYASKASQEYFYGKPWLHEDSSYMDARVNAALMCTEISQMLMLKITEEAMEDFVLRVLFRMKDMAYEYEERHSHFDAFFPTDREYPVSDIQYSLVIAVFIVFAQYLESVAARNEKNAADFIENHELLRNLDFYFFLDGLVQHHRKTLIALTGGNTSCNI